MLKTTSIQRRPRYSRALSRILFPPAIPLGVLMVLVGLLQPMTQPTFTIAVLVIACWLGIMARIIQADIHQAELLNALENRQD